MGYSDRGGGDGVQISETFLSEKRQMVVNDWLPWVKGKREIRALTEFFLRELSRWCLAHLDTFIKNELAKTFASSTTLYELLRLSGSELSIRLCPITTLFSWLAVHV